jgi:riboflavin kinase/FMN adenylyltransferase
VEDATAMLGRTYAWEGTVVKGRRLGRTLGYPTANLEATDEDQLLPSDGVYAVYATVNEQQYPAMLSIGLRPTLGAGLARTVEVNLFDFARDLYGQKVTLHFTARMRGEEKFDSLEALKEALAADEVEARRILA